MFKKEIGRNIYHCMHVKPKLFTNVCNNLQTALNYDNIIFNFNIIFRRVDN
jgi:hypothetical protein